MVDRCRHLRVAAACQQSGGGLGRQQGWVCCRVDRGGENTPALINGARVLKLLVTGGAGFIGSNFIRYFLRAHPQSSIVNLDKLTYAGNLENLADLDSAANYRFVRGDVADAALLERVLDEPLD